MYSIDTIPMIDYGLHVSTQDGHSHIEVPKQQFFTVYGKQGYQITKHNGNELELNGFIIADSLTDFKTKTAALYAALSASGTRAIVLNTDNYTCFVKNGYRIYNVRVFNDMAFAKFQIKMDIIS